MPADLIVVNACMRAVFAPAGTTAVAVRAYADFADDRRGRLKPGFDTDLVSIESALDDLSEAKDAARIALTICGGIITYDGIQ